MATENPEKPGSKTIISGNQNSGIIAGRDIHGGVSLGKAPLPSAEPPPDVKPAKTQTRVLFLGANPQGAPALRLDQELREIDLALRQAEFRDRFDLRQQLAVRSVDLQAALLRHRPEIVHFSGHGEVDGIFLEDETGQIRKVEGSVLARILGVFKKQIRCVVLNACSSQEQAEAIAKDIDCVIGMSIEIGDQAAARFAASFYQALAFGSSVRTAFDLGCAQIDLEGLDEGSTPQLIAYRKDPEEVFFVEPE
jgi:CHAT domain-containing protein